MVFQTFRSLASSVTADSLVITKSPTFHTAIVIANVQHDRQIATTMITHYDTATTYLAQLLLRKTQPNSHAKAKEPNAQATYDRFHKLTDD